MLSDNQLLRYSRHIMLDEVDVDGQQRWLDATALVIGAGGLGSPVILYLAAAGVGKLILVDDDTVELTNLQRQIAHQTDSIGQSKVASAKASALALNPDIEIETHTARLDAEQLAQLVARADIALECTDNFTSRFLLNRLCVEHQVPLVSGAAIRLEGQVAVFDSRSPTSPCYRCLYRDAEGDEQLTCSESGVLAPLVGIIGSIQAMEALKVLAEVGEPLVGKLLLLDGRSMSWRSLKLRRDSSCPVCGQGEADE